MKYLDFTKVYIEKQKRINTSFTMVENGCHWLFLDAETRIQLSFHINETETHLAFTLEVMIYKYSI